MTTTTTAPRTEAEHFTYRWGHNFTRRFWLLYYPRTERFTTDELVTLIEIQAPEIATGDDYFLGMSAHEKLILDCHLARLYERVGPTKLEEYYSAEIERVYRDAQRIVGERYPDGYFIAQFDAVYEEQPQAVPPARLAFLWAKEGRA